MKWAHLPFLFLFSRVTVRSQSERLGRQPIPLRCEFRSECVGCEAVCLLAPAPSAASLHPQLPRSPQTLLIRPLDFCHQGSRGGCVACSVSSLVYRRGNRPERAEGLGQPRPRSRLRVLSPTPRSPSARDSWVTPGWELLTLGARVQAEISAITLSAGAAQPEHVPLQDGLAF